MDIDTSSPTEQRKFGLLMAGAITAVTLIHWLIRGELALWPFYIAGPFLVLAILAPILLKPVLIVWMKFALAVNWVMTRLLLSIVFFLMIVPTRVLMKIFSTDPLKRKWDENATTYWEEPEEQPLEKERYHGQF